MTDFRPKNPKAMLFTRVESEVFPSANGSARVTVGRTDVTCAVKGEVEFENIGILSFRVFIHSVAVLSCI
jgi:ribonuclease PH